MVQTFGATVLIESKFSEKKKSGALKSKKEDYFWLFKNYFPFFSETSETKFVLKPEHSDSFDRKASASGSCLNILPQKIDAVN